MTDSRFRKHTFVLCIGIAILLSVVIWESSAQEGMLTTFSGRVINQAGDPIAGRAVAVMPVVDGNGAWFVIRDIPPSHTESDKTGQFTITTALDGPVLLSLFPPARTNVRILKVQIEGLFFYPSGMGMGEHGVVFATSPGRRIENIKVIIQEPHIRVKVQHIDGTPIANTKVKYRLRAMSLHENSTSNTSGRTDAEGSFTYYTDRGFSGPHILHAVSHISGTDCECKAAYP